MSRLRVLHMASGGFSGATQVARDLVIHGAPRHDTLLVLRRKRHTPMDRVQALRDRGLPVELVAGWSHLASAWGLRQLCRQWKPDVVVGHGFPEHLLARWAGLWAAVPVLVQVEHNTRERYTAYKRWQVRRLVPHTAAFVGVSGAVAAQLLGHGLPAPRVRAIPNGIDLQGYAGSEQHPWSQREPAIIMAARFAAQKDPITLIRALPILAQRHGLRPKLRLAGGGKADHRAQAEHWVARLGLGEQVEFLGHRSDLPQLLMRHQVAALSTHFEGMPLVLAEAMAAGCRVVGTQEPAVGEMLGHGQWGILARAKDPESWADALAQALTHEHSSADADAARSHARHAFSVQRMAHDYTELFETLAASVNRRDHP